MLKRPSIIVRTIAFVLIVCLCLISIDSWRSWNARSAKLHEMNITTAALARAAAQQADDTIKEADTALVDVVERIEHDGTKTVALDRLHRFLRVRMEELPQLDGLFVYDEKGKWLVGALPTSLQNPDISDQQSFIFHRSHADPGPYIGTPAISRLTGKWMIPVSRRIDHADGSFGGVVLVTIDIDFFKAYFRTLMIGEEGSVELISDSGVLMIRRPFNNSLIGETMLDTQLYRSYMSQGPVGLVFIKSNADGVTRLYSYRRLKHYPLFVSTALSRDEVLADWWRDTLWHFGGAIFLVMVVSVFGWRLVKQIELRTRAEREADAANRAKGEFIANMSHELRTPLNGILGYAQILRRDPALGERQLEGVAVIQRSGEHLLTLIDDTLDFAKIEAGKLRVQIGDVPLGGLVDVLREIISVKAEQKGLDFICEIAVDAPAGVRADGQRLRQVLLNLLANAVKFTDHGSVSLHIMRAESGAVRFEVRDTGVGMLAEQLETIFEPFEQVGGHERRVGGTGLGLAISRQFLRAMGAEIHVESRLGEGSVFWFELAAALALLDVPVIAPPARDATGYDGPRKKVLVIDDVPVNRAVVVALLERLGFDTVEAATGHEGLAQAQHERPSLVVTDIVMSDMDGLEVTQRLRQSPGIADVPIIAMSASPSGTDEKRSLDAGVNAFLPKPVDFDRLLAKIAALLGLEWTYAAVPATATATAVQQGVSLSEACLAVPPQEMNELHRLARHGDMREISLWSERVAALDARYVPFAEQVRLLAKGYQSKAILELVEQNIAQRPAP